MSAGKEEETEGLVWGFVLQTTEQQLGRKWSNRDKKRKKEKATCIKLKQKKHSLTFSTVHPKIKISTDDHQSGKVIPLSLNKKLKKNKQQQQQPNISSHNNLETSDSILLWNAHASTRWQQRHSLTCSTFNILTALVTVHVSGIRTATLCSCTCKAE